MHVALIRLLSLCRVSPIPRGYAESVKGMLQAASIVSSYRGAEGSSLDSLGTACGLLYARSRSVIGSFVLCSIPQYSIVK